jgi:hypothetical protein
MVFLAVALVACKSAAATTAASGTPAAGGAGPGPSGSLTGTDKLALGTLKLEGTENAVTPAQAKELLPLWQMIQGGSLQGDQETQAVVKQIEGAMTPAQTAAIDAMALTWSDVQAWMRAQGIEMPTRDATQSGPGGPQNLTQDERAKLQQEFQNMTPEQRATRMAEMGIQRPEGAGQGGGPNGGPGGRGGQSSFLVGPLVELLTQRAAQ